MARCLAVPQDPDIDANSAGLAAITPIAAVVHDTIGVYTGPDSGDSQYIENHGLAHFVVGEDEGEWEQLLDTEVFAAHANGANRMAFGVEFSRLAAGQPLTDWQKRAWSVIREWAATVHGIPNTYLDPTTVPDASVWVNGGTFRGWISHTSVRTDDGTAQHTDWVPAADFVPTSKPPTPTVPVPLEDDMKITHIVCAGGGNSGIWAFLEIAGKPAYRRLSKSVNSVTGATGAVIYDEATFGGFLLSLQKQGAIDLNV